jgi:hypothetical protein
MPTVASPADQGRLINEFFHCYGAFVQSVRLYPRESSSMRDITRDLRQALDRCFEWRSPISLMVHRERLYFEEYLIKSGHSLATRIIDEMLERLIRKVIVQRQVEDQELFALADVLNTPPVELRDVGGPDMALADRNVRNIFVSEISMLVSENEESDQVDSWKNAAQRAGLDVDEVTLFMQGPDRPGYLVDLDAAGQMSRRGARLSRNEVLQLIELLLSPQILAQMMLDLASVPTDRGPMVDPAEVLRIVTRTENTLVFRSAHPPAVIAERLREALRLFDGAVRQALILEMLRRRTSGLQTPNAEVYGFTPDEWAAAIVTTATDEGGAAGLSHLKMCGAEWSQVERRLEELARVAPVAAAVLRSGLGERAPYFRVNPERFQGAAADVRVVAEKSQAVHGQPAAQRKLAELKARMKRQIELGYASAVLGLLDMHNEDGRVQQIAANFFEQIHQLIEQQNQEALGFLSRFSEIMSAKEGQNQQLLRAWLRSDGLEFLAKIMRCFSNVAVEQNREALRKLEPLLRQCGARSLADMLDLCYFDNVRATTGQVIGLFTEIKPEVCGILESYLLEGAPSFSARRFLKALNLYLALKTEGGETVIQRLAASETPAIRLASMLALLAARRRDLALPIMRRAAFEPRADGADEQVLGAYGLTVFQDDESLEKLRKLTERPGRSAGPAAKDVNLALLFSYLKLRGVESRDEVFKLYKKALRPGLAGLISWRR